MTATSTRSPDGRMTRLAAWSQRHHWTAIVLWIVALVGITATSMAVGDDYRNDFSLPGTQSQELMDAQAEHLPEQAGDTVQVVLHDEAGIEARGSEIQAMLAELAEVDHVAGVEPPDARGGTISEDGTVGLATVTLDDRAGMIPTEDRRELIEVAQSHAGDGLQVELSGDAVREVQESDAGGGAEGAGMMAALVILLLLFGSLLAASLPIIAAVFAVGTTIGIVALASHLVTVPDYTAPILMLVGLGVGIDYALLVFSRYRSELLADRDRGDATRIALDTAGRSVLFAGATVIIALLGLYALGLGALQGVALGVTLTVLMTMVASLTLLPCLLTIFGRRIERSVRKHAARRKRETGAGWRRWGALIQRSPWPPLLVAVAALAALATPALGMHLGFADAGNDHPSTTTHQAYDLVSEGFGPGANGPLVVMTTGTEEQARSAHAALEAHDGITSATPPRAAPDGEVYVTLAFPETSPQDERTTALVEELRQDLGEDHLVGGPTAAAVDFSKAVEQRFPLFIAVVVGLSALLLLVVFRSVPIAIKAAVLNLLSIGASLGAIELVFGDGRFGAEAGPIEAFVPVMIFAIVFGLSMDYEVFLVSRMHEEWERSHDSAHAVREGLASTGSVITAAAGIMVVVFGAFILSPDRMLQQFGLGLAVAVLLDALVIRCLVVPAVMRLLGDRAWWTPRWLSRVLPRVRLES